MKTLPVLLALATAAASFVLPCTETTARETTQAHRTSAKKNGTAPARKAADKKSASAADDEAEFINFLQWRSVTEFIDQASAEHGLDREALQSLFRRVQYLDSVVRLINPPPAARPRTGPRIASASSSRAG